MDVNKLSKLKRVELVQLCKERKLAVSGTKEVLIGRLTGNVTVSVSKKKKTASQTKVQGARANLAIERARANRVAIVARRNAHGNYEHAETKFIFDKETKKVIGKQVDDRVVHLNMTDLDICRENNFLVDEDKVDKEFSADQTDSRLKELIDFVDEDEDDESDDEMSNVD